MAYIMFNEDPDHVLSNRAEAGVTQLERSHVDELIEQYKNTAVKDFLICVGSSAPLLWWRTVFLFWTWTALSLILCERPW